jgi:GAF domain-containing protein
MRTRAVSIAGQATVVARLTHERDEALLRETANSEILRLISKSPGDLEFVFRAILENATRICNANFGTLFRVDGESFYPVAQFNTPAALLEAQTRRGPFQPPPSSQLDRVMRTKRVSHTADAAAEPVHVLAATLAGARSLIAVPMLKDDVLIGAIVIYRQEVRPFTGKQIELLQNFASQAVIAIENARLLNELRQRTNDLSEALEQQTATAEVLGVISSSPAELEPVFQAILANATRLCSATFGGLSLYDGEVLHYAAHYNIPPEYTDFRLRERLWRPHPRSTMAEAVRTKQPVQVNDLRTSPAYLEGDSTVRAIVEKGGARTLMLIPMLKDDKLIGVVAIYRLEVRPFTDKQIALVQSFAAQAVIAIENSRLINELRQRTDDLTESLQQQTATSEVLQVISSSPGELQPVFESILANAKRLCEAQFGILYLSDSDMLRFGADVGTPPKFAEFQRQRGVFRPRPGTRLEHVMLTKEISHTADLTATAVPDMSAVLGGARSTVYVPMLKDEEIIGVICIYRQEVRPFTDEQITLVQNFAAQAVIAIENTRLLNELRQRTTDLSEALEQQTAASEVLRVISSSPGELQPVFQTMLENAVRICQAKFGTLFRYAGDACTVVAMHNVPKSYRQVRRREPTFRYSPSHPLARVAATKQLLQIADLQADASYAESDPSSYRAMVGLAGARTILTVPMLKDDETVGAIAIFRQEVRPFADKQIALVQNFAAQAVIAIENARLLQELRERTAQLQVQSEEVIKLNQELEQRVDDQVGEIERMSRLRRFLPPQVADLIVASGSEKHLESHRREITALFCDLRGFTGFSESSDPEDVMALLRDYHAAIGQIIFKYGGTLERFAGDGVMVIFNDPVPVENPPLQAVLMALDMRTAIGTMIEKWRDLGHDISFGIGIAHGFATLGTIGFEGRFDYAAIGTVSNVASRLCDEAKTGQILITPRVRLAVDKAVTVEPVGEFTLKGIRRPMTAYNVLAPSTSKPNRKPG